MNTKVYISILALASTLFVVNVCLSALAGATEGVVFKSQTGKISDKYPSYATPSGWTFMIWNIIFIVIGASLVFGKCYDSSSFYTCFTFICGACKQIGVEKWQYFNTSYCSDHLNGTTL